MAIISETYYFDQNLISFYFDQGDSGGPLVQQNGNRFELYCAVSEEVGHHIAQCTDSAENEALIRATLLGANGLRTDCVLHIAHAGGQNQRAVMVMALDLSSQARVAALA